MTFLTILLLVFFVMPLSGQDAKPPNFSYCGENADFLSNFSTNQLYQTSDVLIAIARLGDGEKNPLVNQARLRQFKQKMRNIPYPQEIILVTGKRVKGDGRIDVYYGGKHLKTLIVRTGCYIDYSCCECNGATQIIKKGKINPRIDCP